MTITKNKKHQTDYLQDPDIIDVKTSESFVLGCNGIKGEDDKVKEDSAFGCLGKHYIVDFWGARYLTNINEIEIALKDAAKISGSMLLHIHLHKFSNGGGITGVALLAESHISVHTWPEHNYAAFDVFMCGNAEPDKAVDLLREVFLPGKVEINEILRGKLE